MIFHTKHFGPVTVEETRVVEFPQGLPGFESCHRFVPLEHPASVGLIFLQSLDVPELCFLTLPVRVARADYRLSIAPEDLELLGLPEGRRPEIGLDVVALAILSFSEGELPTVNLLSPVVMHIATRRAVQAIRPDEQYGCREPLVAMELTC